MTNPFYTPTGVPQTSSQGTSAVVRNEFDLIATGFDKLPALTGNANKAVVIDPTGAFMTVTTGTLTLTGNLTVSNNLTFTGTNGSSVNFGGGGTVLYTSGSYVSSIAGTANEITASAATGAVTLSLPAALTFTGKTVTDGTFNSPTFVTPALGTPASGVVTNLTGTASININGTVGATTPTTGAFTTITASGASISSGTASTTQGSLVLHNTSANSVTIKSSNSTSAAYTLTLPVDDGTSGQVLSTDGSGVTSWVANGTISQTKGDFGTMPTLSSSGGGNSTTYTTRVAKSIVTGDAVIDNVTLLFATASGGSGFTQIDNALSNAPLADVSVVIGELTIPFGLSSVPRMVTMVVLAGTTTGLIYSYDLSAATKQRVSNSNMAVAGNGITYSAAYMK